MITFLSKFFIKEKADKGKIRQEYGILCGMVGIFLNILLFCGKFFAGTISHSIAVTADAFHNLSDAGSDLSWQEQNRTRSIRLATDGSNMYRD